MLVAAHVDEVDDDDAAEISQAQLARDGLRSLEVRLEDRVAEVSLADVAARIDVDRRHGLRLIEDQIAAALQVDPALKRMFDFGLDAVQLEKRPLAPVEGESVLRRRHKAACKVQQGLVVLAAVDLDGLRVLMNHVAEHALGKRQILIEELRPGASPRELVNVGPQTAEIGHVILELLLGRALFGARADDVAALFGFWTKLRHHGAK